MKSWLRGRLPPRPQRRPVALGAMLPGTGALPVPPPAFDYFAGLKPGVVFGNDVYPDCTVAGQAHLVRVITQAVWGREVILPDAQVLEAFAGLGGTVNTGLVEADVLDFMCTRGLSLPGGQTDDVITAYVDIDHGDISALKTAAWIFGGVHLGATLPKEAEVLFEAGADWDIPGDVSGDAPALTGQWAPADGHEMLCSGVDADGFFRVMTWGEVVRVSPRFMAAYVDEAQTTISRLWLQTTGTTTAGLDIDQLLATAARLRAS